MMKLQLLSAVFMAVIAPQVMAGDNLGFDGKIVRPDCDGMSDWFECRKIDDAPADVRRGYEYIHHTSSTLGPDGDVKFPDGTPYSTTTTACSSCHFTGGHVPFGTPMYQSPAKYASRPYFRALNYNRDLEDSIIDCFRNCMNTSQTLGKDDPVMRDMVAYIQWLADGITDPSMQGDGWLNLPGNGLPSLGSAVADMTADPLAGGEHYEQACASCHSKRGPGLGEYRRGEDRPRTPALWGPDGYSRGAAFYNSVNLAGYIHKHMPFEKGETLTAQEALDIAAYINDQERPDGMADQMFCHTEPDGVPASLLKPASWLVGCRYPGEPFTDAEILYGPWRPIAQWRSAEVDRLRSLNP